MTLYDEQRQWFNFAVKTYVGDKVIGIGFYDLDVHQRCLLRRVWRERVKALHYFDPPSEYVHIVTDTVRNTLEHVATEMARGHRGQYSEWTSR